MVYFSRAILTAFVALFLSACASLGTEQPSPSEARLLERAQQYWEARRTGDVFTFFAMESEGRPGGWITPIIASRMGQGMQIESFSLGDVAIDGDSARVMLSAQVRFLAMASVGSPVFDQTVVDQWRWIDGDWYHYTPEWKPLSDVVERWKQENPRSEGEPADREAPEAGRD